MTQKYKKCSVEGCSEMPHAKGWCAHHYHANWRYGTPIRPGLKRYERITSKMPEGTLCGVEDCGRKYLAKGYCRKHYIRFHKHGDPEKTFRGPNGQGSITRGYVRFSIGGKNGRSILAHRYIMEQSLGRPLLSSETVHHKNGVRSDNRLTKGHELHCPSTCCNLELWSKSQPAGQRVRDKIKWAQEIIRMYIPLLEDAEDATR